jgi:hypothetical protein
MKKIALILFYASISSAMVATESRPQKETASSRGRPEFNSFSYDTYVISDLPEVFSNEKVLILENSVNFAAISVETVSSPGLESGDRKVRDVDLCSLGKYSNNTDKRSSLSSKTVRLPRGAIRWDSRKI